MEPHSGHRTLPLTLAVARRSYEHCLQTNSVGWCFRFNHFSKNATAIPPTTQDIDPIPNDSLRQVPGCRSRPSVMRPDIPLVLRYHASFAMDGPFIFTALADGTA